MGKHFFHSFRDANAKRMDHYIIPILVGNGPDTIIIHVGTNDVLNKANAKKQ